MVQESVRTIKKVWRSVPTMDGAGVRLNRVFGFQELPHLDPFLLLDTFRSDRSEDYAAGFPWHPHRGMETITYVLDGDVEHQDSLGNSGVIGAGDVQWMTAGSGIIHQEMPRGNRKGEMWGFQLWSNLPAGQKMRDPRYREVKSGQIPHVRTKDGATVRVIAGQVDGVTGPVREVVTDPTYLDISLPANTLFTHAVKPGHTAFVYVVEGEGRFDAGPKAVPQTEGHIVLFESAGDTIAVSTAARPVRFLLVSGKPLNEPIAWHGPVVMNTEDELALAFTELKRGDFVKRRG